MRFLAFLPFIAWMIFRGHAGITYGQDVSGHLGRASNANTVELAKQELNVALKNMEERGYTEGYTSTLWKTPNEDVGFWYTNIKAARDNLVALPPDADHLTVSNELMKLRETLISHGSEGEDVTDPSGIAVFPANSLIAAWGWISLLGGCIAALFLSVRPRDFYR
ncbi:MAG: hypothetical protein NUV56_00420 [Candidatus Uhrbacteria bacterium]|nr:hypothetical protein [Candidatus Uhrbacteria bacterium]